MSNQNILIILEGKNPEQRIIKRINELFGLDLHISILFGSNIYKLYRTIENDQIIGTAALNTFELMKTACDITFEDHNRKIFDNYTSSDFAFIYLFFDFDPWAITTNAPLAVIKDMLKLFNNPTEQGKLFINYPTIESFNHITQDFQYSYYKFIKGGDSFKKVAGVYLAEKARYSDIRKITYENLLQLIERHLQKANFVCNNKHETPDDESDISQIKLCDIQYNFYTTESKIHIVSSVPAFLFELKGQVLFNIL